MRTSRNHYEVMGLPRSASPAQLKRRYHELVRKFHPDVAKDKATSHRLFIQINEAYEVLSDPDRRKAYDETLDLEAMIESQRVSRASQAETNSQTSGKNVADLLKDAQFAFIQKRFITAVDLCKEALKLNPRSAKTYAMLGDIYRAQGKPNTAIKNYSFAVQYNPADAESQKKMLNLMDKKASVQRVYNDVPRNRKFSIANAFWWSIVFLLIMLIRVYPGSPIPWLNIYIPQVRMWSWNLVGFIAGASTITGSLLCVNGLLKHPDNELVFENSGNNWAVVPVGLILLIGSGFFFVAVAFFYIVFGMLQGSLSRSVMTIFCAVAVIVVLAALMYEPQARQQVLLYGGNVGFLSSLVGWYIGASIKPLSDE